MCLCASIHVFLVGEAFVKVIDSSIPTLLDDQQ